MITFTKYREREKKEKCSRNPARHFRVASSFGSPLPSWPRCFLFRKTATCRCFTVSIWRNFFLINNEVIFPRLALLELSLCSEASSALQLLNISLFAVAFFAFFLLSLTLNFLNGRKNCQLKAGFFFPFLLVKGQLSFTFISIDFVVFTSLFYVCVVTEHAASFASTDMN